MADPGQLVLIDRLDDVAVVTLNRPEKRNALSLELREQLADALDALGGEQTGAIVLTGAGTAFCSGMDVTQFGGDAPNRRRIVETSTRLFRTLALCPTPTVAFVNGPAIAGGFAIALLCDLRLAGEAARMGFPELGRYIPPSYAAARSALPAALARELCMTGRVIDAPEALSRGVVSRIGTAQDAVALAGEVAAAPRKAVREVKRRVLLEAQSTWLPLLEEEERALREAVL
ncbi:MAG TPA: enoyl-CoA hydratase/isomerase family protein [Solirubrobacteraceae bacterium]|jgi:enoyl-CoA hydratase